LPYVDPKKRGKVPVRRRMQPAGIAPTTSVGGPPVGKLYDTCQSVIQVIETKGLDPYKARGSIALETGFLISSIGPEDPDDPVKIEALRDAARRLFAVEV
jgi:hypothetical protein